MKKITRFIAAVLALIMLSGCESSNSTDPESIPDQIMNASEETEAFEYEVQIGDPFRKITESLKSSIIHEWSDAVIWKDTKGYHVACADEDGRTIYAVIWFSDDLELLEADGLEPIDPLPHMEEWLGKTEDEFIALYGPCHFLLGGSLYMPAYISKNGTVCSMEVERGMIIRMHPFSIDGYSSSNFCITTPEETEMLEHEVHVGDSFYTVRASLNSLILDYYDCIMWKDSMGYHFACTGEDLRTICAVVWFSDDLELLEADGLEPIDPLPHMEEWLGKTEDEFIALYGPCHFQAGTGIYMPSYIAKDGTVYWMTVRLGTIDSMHSYAIDFSFSSVYYLPQLIDEA